MLLFLILFHLCLIFTAASLTFFKFGFSSKLAKQKFVILDRAKNLLMQNTSHLHKWNFGTAQHLLQSGFH